MSETKKAYNPRGRGFARNKTVIEEMYMSGNNPHRIARHFGMDRRTLGARLHDSGMTEIKRLRDEDLVAEIVARHQP